MIFHVTKQTINLKRPFCYTLNWSSRNFSSITSNQSFIFNKKLNNNNNNEKFATTSLLLMQRRYFSFNEKIINFWNAVSNSTPVAYLQDGLVKIHDLSGLPWWATIMLSTVLFRTVIILPLAIYQNAIAARLENISLEMTDIVKEVKREAAIAMKKYQWSEKQTKFIYNKSIKKQWNNLIVRDNCHPLKTLIVFWVQMPLWICQSVAIRNLVSMLPDPSNIDAQIIYAELSLGGFGWIPNLTDIDHSLILPITLGIINLSIIQLQTIVRTKPPKKFQKYATNFFRIFAIAMIPIAANVPSCLCLYWVTSSTYALGQNLILLSPNIRRIVGIPKTQSELLNPYQHIIVSLKGGNSKKIK